jgi:hypothetical protein
MTDQFRPGVGYLVRLAADREAAGKPPAPDPHPPEYWRQREQFRADQQALTESAKLEAECRGPSHKPTHN